MALNQDEIKAGAKQAFNAKANRRLVICVAEKILPFLFWLNIVFVVLGAIGAFFGSLFTGQIIAAVVSPIVILLFGTISAVITFYFLYLAQEIRDAIKGEGDGCECAAEAAQEDGEEKPRKAKTPRAKA
jgi:hypothetical protein